MVSEWRVPSKGQIRYAGLHGTLSNPYERANVGVLIGFDSPVFPYGDGSVYHASSFYRGPTVTARLLALPSPWIVSQEFA